MRKAPRCYPEKPSRFVGLSPELLRITFIFSDPFSQGFLWNVAHRQGLRRLEESPAAAARIAALFPNCVTEATDELGKLKRAIDFDLLQQELSADLVEGPQERYRLDWPGKREALALANTPVTLTLRPCREESVDFETTKNLYIEGDNLDALKLLQETYLGKVKMIYIDPPYNTGNDFIYEEYSNPDHDPRGPWMSDNMTGLAAMDARPNLHYDIIHPDTSQTYPPHPSQGWAYEPKRMLQLIQEKRILWPRNSDGRPRIKRFVRELTEDVTGFSTVQTLGYTTDGTRELTEIFGLKIFDFPKPVSLLRRLVEQGTGDQDIILDFFSGSATTAHAVMQLNAEDGGKRRHIMVQLPEPCDSKSEAFKAGYKTIAEIGKERIRRAGKKVLAEWQAKEAMEKPAQGDLLDPNNSEPITHNPSASPPDISFRVLKIDSSNFADIHRTPEDLLFQVLVDWGVDLALPIAEEVIDGKRVFFVDGNALAACFDTGLTDELIKAIAARKPLRAVFRDESSGDDSTRINVGQLFKLLSPNTELKSL